LCKLLSVFASRFGRKVKGSGADKAERPKGGALRRGGLARSRSSETAETAAKAGAAPLLLAKPLIGRIMGSAERSGNICSFETYTTMV